jgi:hypothetical protein
MKKKIFLSILFIVIAFAAGTWYYVFEYSKTHHRDVADEKGIAVNAAQIVKEFQTNEAAANTKYLNKALEVKGVVTEIKKDQSGNTTVSLKSDDAFAIVFCTLKTNQHPDIGSNIIIKGICTGFLSDVVINEAIVMK